jgi:hypothetical protein
MKYEINSTWTNLRRKDIEHLNNIIDDEYCREQEIGRKLNILEVFEKKLNKAIKDFNFDIVIDFMQKNNWTWAVYHKDVDYAVPTREDIIDAIEEDFKHCIFQILECGKKEAGISGGGIVLDMGIVGDYASEDTTWLEIYFDISRFRND